MCLKKDISDFIIKKYPGENISIEVDTRNIARIKGVCTDWQTIVDIGHDIGKIKGVYSVVNDLSLEGRDRHCQDNSELIRKSEDIGVIDCADAVVIGGGVTGCAIARELSRYNLKVLLLEKEEDIACGATKANNGDIHSGYLEKPGTLKARLNVKGNAMYDQWAKELNFNFKRMGNLLVINSPEFMEDLYYAMDLAKKNGVPYEMIDGDKVIEMEPLAAKAEVKPYAALYIPTMGNVDPWEVAIALAENAVDNGVKVILDCMVIDIHTSNGRVKSVVTQKGIINTKYVFNCAGVYADEISTMAGDHCFTIHPRKGVIAIIDKNVPSYNRPYRIVDENRPLKSTKSSKGGGMATTIAGNNLLGPSATEVIDREDMETDAEGLKFALDRSSIKDANYGSVIRYFTGVRPATYTEDFFIEMSPITNGFINVAGIQSPGLASAPAVAEYAIDIMREDMGKRGIKLQTNENFNPYRKPRVDLSKLSYEEKDKLIKLRPEYGRIICRCEGISEGEIIDAINSPLKPQSIDAIKRRTRAGMGRCQGGFCQPRVLEILARETEKEWTSVKLKGNGSEILLKDNRK